MVEEIFEIWLTELAENDPKMTLMLSNIFTMVEENFEIWLTQLGEEWYKNVRNAE